MHDTPEAVSVFAAKIIGLFAKPLGLGLLLILGGALLSRWRAGLGRGLVAVGALGLWTCATPWMGHTLMAGLEAPFPPQEATSVPKAEAIVVLGGGLTPPAGRRTHADLNDAADRLWHAARLYRTDVAPRIIASGGALPWRTPGAPSAPAMEALMTSWGVPADAILREAKSTTTRTNAVYTARLCRDRGIEQVVLVTSAWHMRRALATFRATGLEVVPAPTDHQGIRDPFTLMSVLPDAEGLQDTTTAVHEYLGLLYYWWNGWLTPASGAALEAGRHGPQEAAAPV
jgi:uncharacterized SAM-binding protein YcdF (DUF218 family)